MLTKKLQIFKVKNIFNGIFCGFFHQNDKGLNMLSILKGKLTLKFVPKIFQSLIYLLINDVIVPFRFNSSKKQFISGILFAKKDFFEIAK